MGVLAIVVVVVWFIVLHYNVLQISFEKTPHPVASASVHLQAWGKKISFFGRYSVQTASERS